MGRLKRTFSLVAVAGTAGLPAEAGAQSDQSNAVYVAHLSALNTTVTGLKTVGEAKFTFKGDSLTIAVNASGLPKDIEHWQHFHGFTDGRQAACPTPSADANGDGIIDVVETGAAAGTTMVPFSGDPVSMDVPHGSYPKASTTGIRARAVPLAHVDLGRYLHCRPLCSHCPLPHNCASYGRSQPSCPRGC